MSEVHSAGRLSERIILTCLILSVMALYWTTLRTDHNWGGDFAQYIAQASAISEGGADNMIRQSSFRFNNSDTTIELLGPRLYPWGYPLLLAPVYHFFGLHMVALKLVTSLFFLLSLPVIYRTFHDRLKGKMGLTLVAVLALNPFMFGFKEQIRSDLPLLFFTLLSIFFIKRFVLNGEGGTKSAAGMMLAGSAIFMAYFIKGTGILLLPCLALAQVMEIRRLRLLSTINFRKAALLLLPYTLFLCLLLLANFLVPAKAGPYNSMLPFITLERILGNIVYYAGILVRFFAAPWQALGIALYLITVPFFFIGWAGRFKKDYLYSAFILINLLLFILFPARQGLRFILPLIPFFLYFVFEGMRAVTARLYGTKRKVAVNLFWPAVLALFVCIIGADLYASHTGSRKVDGPYSRESAEMFRYIRDNTPHNSVIIFFKPRVMTLYTGRLSARTANFDKALRIGSNYAVIKKGTDLNLMVNGHEKDITKVFSNGEFIIYRLAPGN